MNPFEGQRRLDVRAEQVVWHLVSAGVLGLVLILLLFSVTILDAAEAPGAVPEPRPSIARPADESAPSPAALETSMQRDRSPSDVHPSRVPMDSEQVRVRHIDFNERLERAHPGFDELLGRSRFEPACLRVGVHVGRVHPFVQKGLAQTEAA